jgi:hypothetical protein
VQAHFSVHTETHGAGSSRDDYYDSVWRTGAFEKHSVLTWQGQMITRREAGCAGGSSIDWEHTLFGLVGVDGTLPLPCGAVSPRTHSELRFVSATLLSGESSVHSSRTNLCESLINSARSALAPSSREGRSNANISACRGLPLAPLPRRGSKAGSKIGLGLMPRDFELVETKVADRSA